MQMGPENSWILEVLHIGKRWTSVQFMAFNGVILGNYDINFMPATRFNAFYSSAEYTDMHSDYTGKGVDQLQDCINKIRSNPTDRRIIMTAWNPQGRP